MKTLAIPTVLFLALPLGADDNAAAKLEGTYKAVALKKDGKAMLAEVVGGFRVKFTAEEVNFTVRTREDGKEKVGMHPAKISVDASKMPATIDISPLDGPEKGKTFPGIFKFENGELVLVFAEKGDRPTDFTGEGEVLYVRLKRDDKK